MERQRKAYFYAFIAVAMWSTVASAFKISLRYLSGMELLLWSSGFSALALLIAVIGMGKLKEAFSGRPRDYFHSAVLGLFNPFLYYAVLFKAYELLPAQEAQPLNFTWPIVLVLLAIPILRQKVSPASLLAFLISFVGVAVIATRGDLLGMRFSDPLGVGLAVGSSLLWAVYWIENVRDKRDEVVKLFLGFVFGFIYSFIAVAALGGLRLPPWQGVAGAAYVGLFEMGLTFIFWMKALKYTSSTDKVAILIYAIPFVSMVFISIFVGETILMSSIIGATLIVAGILLQKRFGKGDIKPAEHPTS